MKVRMDLSLNLNDLQSAMERGRQPGTAANGSTCPGLLQASCSAPLNINTAGPITADAFPFLLAVLIRIRQRQGNAFLILMNETRREPGIITYRRKVAHHLLMTLSICFINAGSGFPPFLFYWCHKQHYLDSILLTTETPSLPTKEPAVFPVSFAINSPGYWKGALGTGRGFSILKCLSFSAKPLFELSQGPGGSLNGQLPTTRHKLVRSYSFPGSLRIFHRTFITFSIQNNWKIYKVKIKFLCFAAGEGRHEVDCKNDKHSGGLPWHCIIYIPKLPDKDGAGCVLSAIGSIGFSPPMVRTGSCFLPDHSRLPRSESRDCPPSNETLRFLIKIERQSILGGHYGICRP